jgi:hypothetical protein
MSIEVVTTREDYIVVLIEGIDKALQAGDWMTVEDNLDTLKGVSPGQYRHVARILSPLLRLRS